MKVLILGANGFIGSAVLEQIAADPGNTVISFSRSLPLSRKMKDNVQYITDDFINVKKYLHIFEEADVIIHTISALLPVSDSYSEELVNVVSPTVMLLDHFKDKQKHFIFLSSGGSVYETGTSEKLTEESALKAYSFYGLSKLQLEEIFLFYQKRYGLNVTILRPSNVFGFRSRNIGVNGIISTLINNAVNSTETQIWGDGNAVRDYIHINDFTTAVCKVAKQKLYGIYNVSSGNAKSVNDIIEIVNKYVAAQCRITYRDNLYHLPEYIVIDNAKIKNDLPLDPQSDFEENIANLVKYYSENKNSGS